MVMKRFMCGILAAVFYVSGVFADITVAPISDNRITVEAATITTIQGEISRDGQRDAYRFTAPRDGRYRFEMAELRNNTRVRLAVLNYLGEQIASDSGSGVGNGNGLTLNGLVRGQNYEIRIGHYNGFSPYNLIIGQQKETVDISPLTGLSDSIQYTDQRNIYSFTAPRDGRYRLEMAELRNNTRIRMAVLNYLGEQIASDSGSGVGNGNGLTLNGLVRGQDYEIRVSHYNGLSAYRLNITGQ
jgi:hypothetical protein